MMARARSLLHIIFAAFLVRLLGIALRLVDMRLSARTSSTSGITVHTTSFIFGRFKFRADTFVCITSFILMPWVIFVISVVSSARAVALYHLLIPSKAPTSASSKIFTVIHRHIHHINLTPSGIPRLFSIPNRRLFVKVTLSVSILHPMREISLLGFHFEVTSHPLATDLIEVILLIFRIVPIFEIWLTEIEGYLFKLWWEFFPPRLLW